MHERKCKSCGKPYKVESLVHFPGDVVVCFPCLAKMFLDSKCGKHRQPLPVPANLVLSKDFIGTILNGKIKSDRVEAALKEENNG